MTCVTLPLPSDITESLWDRTRSPAVVVPVRFSRPLADPALCPGSGPSTRPPLLSVLTWVLAGRVLTQAACRRGGPAGRVTMAEPPRRRRIPMLRTGSTARSISEETDDSQSDSERYEDDRPAVYTFVEWVRPSPPQPAGRYTAHDALLCWRRLPRAFT